MRKRIYSNALAKPLSLLFTMLLPLEVMKLFLAFMFHLVNSPLMYSDISLVIPSELSILS